MAVLVSVPPAATATADGAAVVGVSVAAAVAVAVAAGVLVGVSVGSWVGVAVGGAEVGVDSTVAAGSGGCAGAAAAASAAAVAVSVGAGVGLSSAVAAATPSPPAAVTPVTPASAGGAAIRTAPACAAWLTKGSFGSWPAGIIEIVTSGCRRLPKDWTSRTTRSTWAWAQDDGSPRPARTTTTPHSKRTASSGSPHVNQRDAAGCSSRPQWGHTTRSEEARCRQRRQRIIFSFAAICSPQLGQTVACTFTSVLQLGHGRTPAVRMPVTPAAGSAAPLPGGRPLWLPLWLPS